MISFVFNHFTLALEVLSLESAALPLSPLVPNQKDCGEAEDCFCLVSDTLSSGLFRTRWQWTPAKAWHLLGCTMNQTPQRENKGTVPGCREIHLVLMSTCAARKKGRKEKIISMLWKGAYILLNKCSSNINVHMNHLRLVLKCTFCLSSCGVALRSCLPHKLPADAGPTAARTT